MHHIDCYLLMDMQSVMAIILYATSTVISLWTCSLSWPSSCAPHQLLSPYGHAVCHGHHLVRHIDCYLLMDMQSVMAIILCTTSTVISLWTCSLSWPSSCTPHRLLSPYGHAVCHGHHPVEDHVDCYLLAFSLAIILYTDCYLLMDMQFVLAIILCTTSTVISLWTCSLSWPSSCAPHRLLSPYGHAVCHGHHPVEDHIDCYLLAFSLAIIMYKTTSAVINCYFFTFSLACRRSSRLLSPYFQHGHHPLEDHIGSHLYKITSPSYPYFQSCHHPVEDCFGSHIFTFSLAIIA